MARTTTKSNEVLRHLKNNKTITSMEAIELYGATRLSAIIFNLRKHYDIDMIWMDGIDRYGNSMRYGKYIYKGGLVEDGSDSI